MMFSKNITFLRKRKKKTQGDVAHALSISRSTINSYENGSVKNPTIEALIKFSNYYRFTIDTLIKVDLSMMPQIELISLQTGYTNHS